MNVLEAHDMAAIAIQTVQRSVPGISKVSIFQRIANREKVAVALCIDTYGIFIWALAKKFTASREEAEAATQEIFIDIWRFAERDDFSQTDDDQLVSLIARRRLFKYLHQPENIDRDDR